MRAFPLLLSALLSAALPAAAATVVPAEDTAAVLHNPDMGWVFYEFGQEKGKGYAYPGVDYVAIATRWQGIERQMGVYDFSGVDGYYDYWASRGKRVMLRLFAEDVGTLAPAYVRDRMAPAELQSRTALGYTGYAELDARDAFYRERLGAFLRAVAAHFSLAAGRPVVTVDLRGYGLWGEWHSGFIYPGQPGDLSARREALSGILAIWSRSFPGVPLLLSYSHDPDSDPALWSDPRRYGDFVRWSALDSALAKPNISFRRDGAYGAMQPNERRFCEYAFATARKAPLMSEFTHGYVAGEAARAVDDALSLHPNFICVYGYGGSAFYDNDRGQFDRGLRTMGYRLVPLSVSFPDTVRAGGSLPLTMRWGNRGVGRALADFGLRVSLRDASGKAAATFAAGATGSQAWLPGGIYPLSRTLPVGDVPAGTYRLCLSVVDPRSERPIALPLAGATADGAYPIGNLRVAGKASGLAGKAAARAAGGNARVIPGGSRGPAYRGPGARGAAGLRDARGRSLSRGEG